jgi:hypothetical protein
MLHYETVSPTLLKIIETICGESTFDAFRLVGGTALSLHLGHRKSVDADFFSDQPFDHAHSVARLTAILPGFMVVKQSIHGYAAVYQQVKIDVYTWQTQFLLPAVLVNGIRLADLPEIAALKFEAIINRKEEKDFRDVYALLQKFSLADLLGFFRERYPNYSPRLVTDHLLAAPYVERDLGIELITDIPWEQVGVGITSAVQHYYEESIRNREQQEQDRLRQRIEALKKGRDDLPE